MSAISPSTEPLLQFYHPSAFDGTCTRCRHRISAGDPTFYVKGTGMWCVPCATPEEKTNTFYLRFAQGQLTQITQTPQLSLVDDFDDNFFPAYNNTPDTDLVVETSPGNYESRLYAKVMELEDKLNLLLVHLGVRFGGRK